GTIWNTYQDETYRLPRRIAGLQRVTFVFSCKVHLKGFIFTPDQKAYAQLAMSECSSVTADSYRRVGGAFEGLRNNATIIFDDLEFSDGCGVVTLCWRANRRSNAVELLFEGEGKREKVMLALKEQPQYGVMRLPLGIIVHGKQRVGLHFFPGTEIDLAWIQFGRQVEL
ncbi:MAG: hypothetical protein WC954_07495, partial [Sphaerochaeta sp.]